jgi:membrane-bound lytic murein transglycosylase B
MDVRDGEMTWKRLVFAGALIAVVISAGAAAGATVVPQLAGQAKAEATEPPQEVINPPTEDPSEEPTPSPTGPEVPRPAAAFADWASELSGKVDIPQTALEAYGYAEWVIQQTTPSCKISWTTLAGVAKITSDHGRSGGGKIDSRGQLRPALTGPALNGSGGQPRVGDSDGGALDGDTSWDHAIGPMLMTPAMWRASGVDGDSDGLADPQDIDDASLGAAYHLCAAGGDISVVANWKKAISGYHGLSSQIDKIFESAQSYGAKSKE